MFRVRGAGRWVPVLLVAAAAGGASATEPPGRQRRVVSAAFAPDGRALAALESDGTVSLWDVASGRGRKLTGLALGKGEVPRRVRYTPGGDVAVLVYRYEGFGFDEARGVATQGTLSARVWNVTTGKRSPFVRVGHGGVAVCPEGRLLAYDGGLWEVATGKKVRAVALPRGLVYEITFAPDGKTLAYWLCESLAQDAGLIVLVDVASGKKLFRVGEFDWDRHRFGGFVTAPVFAPDGKGIAFAEPDRPALHLWDVAAGKEVRQIPLTKSERVVGFSPDGRTLVSWRREGGLVRLWEKATGKERRAGEVGGGVESVTLSPDGRTVALTKGGAVTFRKLWD